jgi:hypothetical protein
VKSSGLNDRGGFVLMSRSGPPSSSVIEGWPIQNHWLLRGVEGWVGADIVALYMKDDYSSGSVEGDCWEHWGMVRGGTQEWFFSAVPFSEFSESP